MTMIVEFLQAHPVVLKVIAVALLIHGVSGLVYLIPKVVFSRPLPLRLDYLLSPLMFVWFPVMELMRPPWWRKKWLERSGVAEGSVVLEEGFGFGTSPMIAARMVGPTGRVYALDVSPTSVGALWFRAKLYRLENLEVILAGAKHTGLPQNSVDVVFIADAFHEFPDKQGTLMELHRILREDGVLSILEDTQGKVKKAAALAKDSGLFSLVEQDGKFRKFQKAAATHLPETSVTEEGWAAKVGRPSRSSG